MSKEQTRVNEGRTAVRTAGGGVEQTPLEGRGEPLDYLFVPGIRQEHLHKMYRTSQTSANSSSAIPSLFGWVGLILDAARFTGLLPLECDSFDRSQYLKTTKTRCVFLYDKNL